MTDDLLDLALAIADRASGPEAVESFVTHERNFEVKVYEGAVESLASAEPRGAGVRVVSKAKVGFAFTTDLSDDGINALVSAARDNATHATSDNAVALAEPSDEPQAQIAGLFDDAQSSVLPEDKVAFAMELERATRAVDERIRNVEEAVYSDSLTHVAIANSSGLAGSYQRSDAWCYSMAIAEEDGDTQIGFEFDLARGIGSLDPGAVGLRAAERGLGVLRAKKIPSARMPVVFDPYTAGQFLGVLGSALTGEAVQKGRSLFAGRIGEEVAASNLALVDDRSVW